MKSGILLLLVTIIFISCSTDSNTTKAIEWINKAQRPIIVKSRKVNGLTLNLMYTLIDAKGQLYYCGETDLSLPDTLK